MFSRSTTPDPRLARYDHLIIHVTATPVTMKVDDTVVYLMHRQRGFRTTGYHALITREGLWLDTDMGAKMRPIGEAGAHVGDCGPGWNGRSFAISMVGGVDANNRPENNMNAQQFATLATGIRRFLELHPAPQFVKIMGHRDLIKLTDAPPKACPCFDVQHWLDKTFQYVNPAAVSTNEAGRDEDTNLRSAMKLGPTWTINPGDTLSKISHTTGVPIVLLEKKNPGINARRLVIGSTINL
jgi:N-acetylmuramoyl-L-alanine amidase